MVARPLAEGPGGTAPVCSPRPPARAPPPPAWAPPQAQPPRPPGPSGRAPLQRTAPAPACPRPPAQVVPPNPPAGAPRQAAGGRGPPGAARCRRPLAGSSRARPRPLGRSGPGGAAAAGPAGPAPGAEGPGLMVKGGRLGELAGWAGGPVLQVCGAAAGPAPLFRVCRQMPARRQCDSTVLGPYRGQQGLLTKSRVHQGVRFQGAPFGESAAGPGTDDAEGLPGRRGKQCEMEIQTVPYNHIAFVPGN